MFGVENSGQNSKYGKSERCHNNNFAGRAAPLSLELADQGHRDALVARGDSYYHNSLVFVFVFFKCDEKYKIVNAL